MPKFPQDENKIIDLANNVIAGMTADTTTFPNPPTKPSDLQTLVDQYNAKNNEIQMAKADWMQKTQDKNEILEQITDATRDDIDYAQIMAKDDNAKLEQVGWSVRAAPNALQSPGQCRAFEIIGQGDGWVRFDWKEPSDGGKVAAYKIQRSEDGVNFTDAATVTESEGAVFNQPTSAKLIYQAVALNRAGVGLASNTVTISF